MVAHIYIAVCGLPMGLRNTLWPLQAENLRLIKLNSGRTSSQSVFLSESDFLFKSSWMFHTYIIPYQQWKNFSQNKLWTMSLLSHFCSVALDYFHFSQLLFIVQIQHNSRAEQRKRYKIIFKLLRFLQVRREWVGGGGRSLLVLEEIPSISMSACNS